ncbi:hypothetical protein, partial [Stutzerimonas nitrititolerans]|uniref:hypothetical protein n=1 Tax=Stutzerimonas nitrititolerans TaxID=2482751 RepID=UPI00289EEA60
GSRNHFRKGHSQEWPFSFLPESRPNDEDPSVSLGGPLFKSFLASKQPCVRRFRLAATSISKGLILAMSCVIALAVAIRKSRRFVICLNGLRQTVCSATKNLYFPS